MEEVNVQPVDLSYSPAGPAFAPVEFPGQYPGQHGALGVARPRRAEGPGLRVTRRRRNGN
jgi:hypothetical protein